jgi:hypothetical protein
VSEEQNNDPENENSEDENSDEKDGKPADEIEALRKEVVGLYLVKLNKKNFVK